MYLSFLNIETIQSIFSCRFAPGTWTCAGSYGPGCTTWDEPWVIEDFSGDGTMLAITYKIMPPCKCSCPDVGTICDGPCHYWDCDWIATCSNGQISGSLYHGNRRDCKSTLTGLVNQNSVVFKFGDHTSHGSK